MPPIDGAGPPLAHSAPLKRSVGSAGSLFYSVASCSGANRNVVNLFRTFNWLKNTHLRDRTVAGKLSVGIPTHDESFFCGERKFADVLRVICWALATIWRNRPKVRARDRAVLVNGTPIGARFARQRTQPMTLIGESSRLRQGGAHDDARPLLEPPRAPGAGHRSAESNREGSPRFVDSEAQKLDSIGIQPVHSGVDSCGLSGLRTSRTAHAHRRASLQWRSDS